MQSVGVGMSDIVKDKPQTPLVLVQALRAIAAGMVVFFHIYTWQVKYFPTTHLFPKVATALESGVDLFFVISGFIMMHITPRAFVGWRDQAAFLFRRFARIYPTYWAVALPLLLVYFWNPTLFNSFEKNQVNVPASLLLLPSRFQLIFVAWTLVCELFYYIIASFIFYGQGRARLYSIGVWTAVILGANLIHPQVYWDARYDTIFASLTIEFIGGMILAHMLSRGLPRISPVIAGLLVVISLFSMMLWGAHHQGYGYSPERFSRALGYGMPALVIIWMTLQMDIQGEWRWLARLAPVGDRSYDIYLIHLPIVSVVFRVMTMMFQHSGTLGMVLVTITVVVALIIPVECLHQFIEKPSHEAARRLSNRIKGARRSGGAVPAPSSA